MTTPRLFLSAIVLLLLLLGASARIATGTADLQTAATPSPASDPPCGSLGEIVEKPIVDPARFCPEYLLAELPRSSTAAITSIAYAPPCDELEEPRDWCGALFFVRPDEGALMWVGARNPETNTYAIHSFATGLLTPNGLTWYEGAWYVSGEQSIYRLADDDGDNAADAVEIVVDDLPHGAGEWTGSVGIGPDGRIYVSKGASCNACEEADPRRAAILSYAMDGSDEQIVASGLHNAFDFAWHPVSGDLWTAENGRDFLGEDIPLDELNRITRPGQHFGWPYCYHTAQGIVVDETVPNATAEFCQQTTPPELTFTAHSSPAGMIFYHGEAFPELEGDLLLLTSGSWNRRLPSGYALIRICFDGAGDLETCTNAHGDPVLDKEGHPTSQEVLIPVDAFYPEHDLDVLHFQDQSFYPDHPIDVAISPEGLITVSVMEGRLIQLRPAPG